MSPIAKVKKTSSKSTDLSNLGDVINRSIKKVGGKKENDLCKYLPAKDGYIHHFTMRKMKNEEPTNLKKMLEKYIINTSKPISVPPKKRAPRGSRKRPGHVSLTRAELECLITLAQKADKNDIIAKLTPKKSLAACRKELVRSIKNGEVRADLWMMYSEIINTINAVTNPNEAKTPGFTFTTST